MFRILVTCAVIVPTLASSIGKAGAQGADYRDVLLACVRQSQCRSDACRSRIDCDDRRLSGPDRDFLYDHKADLATTRVGPDEVTDSLMNENDRSSFDEGIAIGGVVGGYAPVGRRRGGCPAEGCKVAPPTSTPQTALPTGQPQTAIVPGQPQTAITPRNAVRTGVPTSDVRPSPQTALPENRIGRE